MQIVPSFTSIRLSAYELAILRHVAEGKTLMAIAIELGRPTSTIKNRWSKILRKLGAQSGPHAVAIGFRTGWLQ